MISDKQAEECLTELATTDEDAAELKVDVERKNFVLKRTESAVFKTASGNIEERKAEARISSEYQKAEEDYLNAYLASEKINNRRKSIALLLDVYRTQSANRRMG